MITRKEIADLMELECNVCKHLFKQLPKNKMNYRPGKNMRSTLELLRYISFCGTECTRIILLDSFKTQNWKQYEIAAKKSQSLKPGAFVKAMDRQIKDIRALFKTVSERDLATRKVAMPLGGTKPLGTALMETSFRFMSGYRMQLFLYAKASGRSKLKTSDCWFGKK